MRDRGRGRECGPFKTASITANAVDISFGDGEIAASSVWGEKVKQVKSNEVQIDYNDPLMHLWQGKVPFAISWRIKSHRLCQKKSTLATSQSDDTSEVHSNEEKLFHLPSRCCGCMSQNTLLWPLAPCDVTKGVRAVQRISKHVGSNQVVSCSWKMSCKQRANWAVCWPATQKLQLWCLVTIIVLQQRVAACKCSSNYPVFSLFFP